MKCIVLVLTVAFLTYKVGRVYTYEPGSCAVQLCNGRNKSSDTIENCRCDANCTTYADCCADSVFKTKIMNARSDFDCQTFPSKPWGTYVKRKCSRILRKRKCLSSNDYDEQVENVLLKIPVMGANGWLYGNQFCASCDFVSGYISWNISVNCDSFTKITNFSDFNRNSSYRKTAKMYWFNSQTTMWNYVDANNATQNCTISPVYPASFYKSWLRKCYPNVVSSCPFGSPAKYRSKCKNYTSVVPARYNSTRYKNEYCALCNNVSTNDLVCRRNSSFKPSPSPTTLAATTPTLPQSTTVSASSAASSSANANVSNREFLHIRVKQNCLDFLESVTITKLQVETKSSSTAKRSRLRRVVPLSEYPIRVCEETDADAAGDDEYAEADQKSFWLRLVVNAGVAVSIVFTSLHLYDFFFTPFVSSLTQKTSASYAIAVVIGNVGFFASNSIDNLNLCHMLGAITYFGFLSSFFWLSALAFDISCKVWSCVQEFHVLNKNITNSQKFTAYSLISWIFPPVATFIMTYVAQRNDDFVLEGSVYETCWFQSDQTLLLFFVFPLTITMSVNLAFYAFSAYVVYNQRSAVLKLFARYAIDFKFHTAQIVANNLMWSVALTAMYYESSFFWICFAILNATLGFLVYLSSPVKHEISTKISLKLDHTFGLNGVNSQSQDAASAQKS